MKAYVIGPLLVACAVVSACGVLDGLYGASTVSPFPDVLTCANTEACFDATLVCSPHNGLLCGLEEENVSCSGELPREPVCKLACADSGDCEAGFTTCVEVSPGNGSRERGCEELRCSTTNNCDQDHVCAQPLRMEIDVDGFCLHTCDPIACFGDGGVGCACDDVFNHCAPVNREGTSIEGFACTTAGDVPVGGACTEAGDCVDDCVCVPGSPGTDGTCRAMCAAGGECDAGDVCAPVFGDAGVCVPTPK